jgi:hypothetical protein
MEALKKHRVFLPWFLAQDIFELTFYLSCPALQGPIFFFFCEQATRATCFGSANILKVDIPPFNLIHLFMGSQYYFLLSFQSLFI